MISIAITSASLPTKKRILTVCVKLFLEKGYKQTTLAEINEKAGVSYSQFQNIFRAKDGVLTELVEFMFSSQFGAARKMFWNWLYDTPAFSLISASVVCL